MKDIRSARSETPMINQIYRVYTRAQRVESRESENNNELCIVRCSRFSYETLYGKSLMVSRLGFRLRWNYPHAISRLSLYVFFYERVYHFSTNLYVEIFGYHTVSELLDNILPAKN